MQVLSFKHAKQTSKNIADKNFKDIEDNKLFWRNVKSYFGDKGSNSTKITLVEKDMIITDKKQIANIMNEHFVAIRKKFSTKPSISSKDSDSDFFHDHISMRRSKKFIPK